MDLRTVVPYLQVDSSLRYFLRLSEDEAQIVSALLCNADGKDPIRKIVDSLCEAFDEAGLVRKPMMLTAGGKLYKVVGVLELKACGDAAD